MKIPKKLKIGGLIWTVKEDDNVSREGNCYGSTHHTSQNIFLEPRLSIQKRDQTFIHELLHAAWDATGLSANKEFTQEKEELIIRALGNGMHQILNDNHLLK